MLSIRISMAVAMALSVSTSTSAQLSLSCPAPITVKTSESGIGHCSAAAAWVNPEAGNCDRSALLEMTLDEAAPQIVRQGAKHKTPALEVGVHQLKYVIAKGNQVQTCNTTITVVDDEPPVIKNCPTEITLSLSANNRYTMPDLLKTVQVSDNCEGFETIQYPEPGSYAGADGDIVNGFIITSAYFNSASTTCAFSIRLSNPILAYQDVATVETEKCEEAEAAALKAATQQAKAKAKK